MKLKPIVPLMSLIFAATLTGCNLDGSSKDSDSSSGGDSSGGGSVVETSPLADGYWDIGSSTAAATLSGVSTYADAVDLPNVYVFDGTTQYYYNDDATPGTYVIKGPTSITEDINAGTLTFTYYDASGETPVDGTYSVSDSGELNIDTAAFGTLSGTNESGNDAVKAAVTAANADAGIVAPNQSARIIDTIVGDTGELRVKLINSEAGSLEPIASGKVTVELLQKLGTQSPDAAEDTVDNSVNLSLYTETKEDNNNSRGIITFTSGGNIKYRDSSGSTELANASYTPGEKLNLELAWAPGTLTLTVNGTKYEDVPYVKSGSVATVSVRLGANDDVSTDELLIDNLAIYSGSTSVFSDDFESYSVGTELGVDGDRYNVSGSSEASIVSE
ncbi:hypothetical protein [Vibrio algivorus]|uniref:Uncharacterized protein n=1 Tax=Vibrio algivorus TaxID=1667024 RepID=A0A557NZV3_9VIBR|nr:hypothetical protein [Vibrio algivorus]TVO33942.1 hypothetical protein FOF44_14305 [Vibrio algivorus]